MHSILSPEFDKSSDLKGVKLSSYIQLFILVVAAIALYGRWLDAPLVFDDINFFSSNYISQYSSSFQPFSARFWPYASFAHEALLLGHTYTEMRALNLAIHVLNAFLLGAFIAKLMAMSSTENLSKNTITLSSSIGALVFLLHPVTVYAVEYLIQRSILMATLFSFAMWITYLEAIQSKKSRWLLISVIFFYLAVFSKQQAILSFFVIVFITYLYWDKACKSLSTYKISFAFILYFSVLIISLNQNLNVIAKSNEPLLAYLPTHQQIHHASLISEIYLRSLLTQGEMFFNYLKLILIPNPYQMSVDMRLGLINNPESLISWIGIIAYFIFGAVSLYLLRKRNLIGIFGLGLLIFFTLFLVEFSTVREQEVFVLYRSYLWMPGLIISIGVAAYWLMERINTKIIALIAMPILITLTWASDQRLSTFSSEKLLWSDAIRLFETHPPANYILAERAYYARGLFFAKERKFPEALGDINKSIDLNSDYYLAYYTKGQIEFEIGNYDDAKDSFQKALKIRDDYFPARVGLDLTLIKIGRKKDGLRDLRNVCTVIGYASACFYYHELTAPDTEFVFIPLKKN